MERLLKGEEETEAKVYKTLFIESLERLGWNYVYEAMGKKRFRLYFSADASLKEMSERGYICERTNQQDLFKSALLQTLEEETRLALEADATQTKV